MKGHNKRAITTYVPSPTSKPILPKKADAKETPNKTIQKEIWELEQKNHIDPDNTGIKQGNNDDPWQKHRQYGSDTWCAAKNKCKNRNERATSRKKCANCLGCTHLECFGNNKRAFCLTCEDVHIRNQPKDKASINITPIQKTNNEYKMSNFGKQVTQYGSEQWCAAAYGCLKKKETATSQRRCNNCGGCTHPDCFSLRNKVLFKICE
jgi:hypothetical protein